MAKMQADVVIIGGAVMGSSIAAHLAQRGDFLGKVVVVEADPSYQYCASARSAASIRQQFSSEINIRISLYGIEFLRNIGTLLEARGTHPDVGLHEGGYLFLATPEQREELRAAHVLQKKVGADIAFFERDELKARFPWMNVEDIAAGCHGLSGEGWFDGYALMQAFRSKARLLEVEYINDKVVGLEAQTGGTWKVTLSDGGELSAGVIVNTAGASGGTEVCRRAGLEVPVHSRKRMIFTFHCREELPGFPMLIDTDGSYVRPEGDGYICGVTPSEEDDPDSSDFEVDYNFFEQTLWPTLASRVPAFEAIKPGRAWAGHYDMNLFDANAFVGAVPGLNNFYMALGFSGHGLQQSPAIGRGLAELITCGHYESLDLSPLGFERLAANRKSEEANIW